MKTYFPLLFLFLLFCLVFFPKTSLAKENLQALIDAAKEGDTISLENQTYEGNISINKAITLVGSENTIIKGDGTGNVISVHAPGVTLKNLTVLNGSMDRNSSEEYAAVKVYTNDNVIDHLTIRDSFHGIYLSQSHHNLIQNVKITGLGKGKIAEQGNGLHIYYSNNNTLKNNKITGTRDGMFFDYGNKNSIEHNQISETRYGLHYMYSDDNTFKHNTFTFNVGGAAIMNSNRLRLADNEFIFNYGHQSFGLLLLSANEVRIENNLFFLNQRGLYIDQSTGNLIKDNKIVKNQIGIELWASSNEQTFTLNQIDENTIPVVTLGGQGKNDWSKDHKGNNWGGTFPLTDLNRNGIGDQSVEYQTSLDKLLEDQELTYLFLKSPAISVFEKMNELFHNDKAMLIDDYPIMPQKKELPFYSWIGILAVIIGFIFLKGRHRLWFIFGRNGRKT